MFDVHAAARAYARQHGTVAENTQPYHHIDTDYAARVADCYQNAAHTPDDAAVSRSYRYFVQETLAQYDTLIDAGLIVEPWVNRHEPYADSAAMLEDLRAGHLYVLMTDFGDMPNNHPMAAPSGRVAMGVEITCNDVFRAVHDAFGHGRFGWSFGPRGEDNAYVSHSTMYTIDARMALACETRGQSMWVNYGEHIRREDESIPRKGDGDYLPLSARPFAVQKSAWLPSWVYDIPTSYLWAGGAPCELRDARTMVGSLKAGERVVASSTQGLSLDEFEKLSAVKARTCGADVLSADDISRLSFVRWCYQHGKVTS